jgi:uroporphyrinogen decarboxylase
MTSKRERIEAAIAGDVADRPPVALWRHFPVDDQQPNMLAEATAEFQQTYDFDFVKVTPASSFCLLDWGVKDVWRGNTEGTRDYTHRVIETPEDWHNLEALDADRGSLGAQLECLRILKETLGGDVPIIQTIFNPLAQAKNLAGGERLLEHLRSNPEDIQAGLETITQTTVDFAAAALGEGIAGIFYAIQHANRNLMDRETYSRYGETFDLRILEVARTGWLNVLHLHGEALMFDLVESLPVDVVNWHDRVVGPSLKEARGVVPGAVCGGLRREDTLVLGDPDAVKAEAQGAIRSVDGRGMVLGSGCVVPITAPRANLMAARSAAEFV